MGRKRRERFTRNCECFQASAWAVCYFSRGICENSLPSSQAFCTFNDCLKMWALALLIVEGLAMRLAPERPIFVSLIDFGKFGRKS